MTDHTAVEREREDAIVRITARYADEYRAGLSPRPDDYIERFPQFARELADFFLYFHTITVDLPDPDPVPAPQLSPAALAAQARIREQYAQQYALAGLAKRGKEVGVTPPALAKQVGISTDFLARLEERAIKAIEIPRTLIRRLADALRVAPEAVAFYLSGGSASQAGQPASLFYYADSAPQLKQDGFLDAVRASAMSDTDKAEWERIAREEGIGA